MSDAAGSEASPYVELDRAAWAALAPETTTPLAALVEKADLSQRMTPEQYDAAKVSARAGRAAKKIAARAKSSKDEPKQLGS